MTPLQVPLRRLDHGRGLPLPRYASAGAAGMDVFAAVDESLTLAPRGRALVPTGFCLAVPRGYEAQVRPRSGLALRHGVTVLNSPGTVDSDYRGEVGVLLVNLGDAAFQVTRGLRIAQLVVAAVRTVAWDETTAALPESDRGTGGFGSTGTG